jgi:hypothetical protein
LATNQLNGNLKEGEKKTKKTPSEKIWNATQGNANSWE